MNKNTNEHKNRCRAPPGYVTKSNNTTTRYTNKIRPKANGKNRKNETQQSTIEAAAAVCGASTIGKFYLRRRSGTLLPVCRFLPFFANRGFPTTATSPSPFH